MKASILKTIGIMFVSAWVTAKYCSLAIIQEFRGKLTRKMVNDYLQLWATGIMKAVRVDCKVFNAYQVEFKEHEPYILMVNHSSLYDIPITFVALPNITMRMLAKKELFQIPIFGQGLKVAEFVFIDRKNREQAMKDLAQAKEKLESGIRLWIAPEGTRSRNGQLGPFKKGGFVTAIQTKAKIIPIIIKGAANILPPKTWRFHINQTVEVHIGQPIDAAAYSVESKQILSNVVRKSMESLLS